MKRIYRDEERKVHIKVATSEAAALGEVIGAKGLSRCALVPQIELLDTKTLQISSFTGKIGSGLPAGVLNDLVVNYLRAVKGEPVLNPPPGFSLASVIESLRMVFTNRRTADFLDVLQNDVGRASLYPVHGDLQKQNLFVLGNRLGLIDFEHFVFAPLELELVNSVFFRDRNCLDVECLIPTLIKMGIFNPVTVEKMFMVYALQQIRDGRCLADVNRRIKRGKRILDRLLGRKCESVFVIDNMIRSNCLADSTICFV